TPRPHRNLPTDVPANTELGYSREHPRGGPRCGRLRAELLAQALAERVGGLLLLVGDLHQPLQTLLEAVALGAVAALVEVDVNLLDLGRAELFVDQLVETADAIFAVVHFRTAYSNHRARYPIPPRIQIGLSAIAAARGGGAT